MRISEKTLINFSIIGGSVGALFGIFIFNHKISKSPFLWKISLVVITQIVLLFFMRT